MGVDGDKVQDKRCTKMEGTKRVKAVEKLRLYATDITV